MSEASNRDEALARAEQINLPKSGTSDFHASWMKKKKTVMSNCIREAKSSRCGVSSPSFVQICHGKKKTWQVTVWQKMEGVGEKMVVLQSRPTAGEWLSKYRKSRKL